MVIGEIGSTFRYVRHFEYLSTQTFFDFDLLILDLNKVVEGCYDKNFSNYIARRENLKEFITHSNMPLIVFSPNFQFRSVKGSGSVDAHQFIPSAKFSINNESGYKFKIVPNTPFADFFAKYEKYFEYESYFTEWNGQVVLETPTKKVLSFYNDDLVFLPKIKRAIENIEQDFLSDLFNVACSIRKSGEIVTLPDWAKNYYLPGEKNMVDEIKTISAQKEALEKLEMQKQNEYDLYVRLKTTFTSYGSILEAQLTEIFSELDFEILESEPNRSDLTVKHKDRFAVIEIKGLTGTAAERNSVQLEKWKSEFHEKNEIEPKGILIVNSHRELELSARVDMTFPHQMLKYAEKKEHCLITSLQLLCLYFSVKKDGNKEELINSLFDTVGVYKGFEDWKNYIDY